MRNLSCTQSLEKRWLLPLRYKTFEAAILLLLFLASPFRSTLGQNLIRPHLPVSKRRGNSHMKGTRSEQPQARDNPLVFLVSCCSIIQQVQ